MFSLEKTFTAYADPHTALKSVLDQACLNDEMVTSTSDTLSSSVLWKLVSHNRSCVIHRLEQTKLNSTQTPIYLSNMHACAEGNKRDVFDL